jgi:hypothetical protein
MRRIPNLVLSTVTAFTAFTTLFAGVSALADKNFEAPGSISPGQTATLRWFFTGSRLTVSGGQFAPGTVITGKQILKVSPKKTTTYVFDLYYHPGVAAELEKTAAGKPVHAQYKVTVEVVSGAQTGLLSYKGTHGWRVGYQTGWTAMPNREGSDDMMFFQQEEDAVERLAVTIVPLKNETVQQLMDDVRADIPSSYTHYDLLSQTEFTVQGLPAVLATFTGNAAAHPGTRTTSMMMAVVNGGWGYVVSARTAADRFPQRQPLLDKMLHSFALTGKIVPPQTANSSAVTALSTGAQAVKATETKSLASTPVSDKTANAAVPDKSAAATAPVPTGKP